MTLVGVGVTESLEVGAHVIEGLEIETEVGLGGGVGALVFLSLLSTHLLMCML